MLNPIPATWHERFAGGIARRSARAIINLYIMNRIDKGETVNAHVRASSRTRWTSAVVLVTVAALAAIGLRGESADASHHPELWTQTASTCTPDEDSVGRYDVHVGDFKHERAAVGQIVTRCNVTMPQMGSGRPQQLDIRYRDQDGLGSRQRVRVRLMQYDINGRQVVVASFDSNQHLGGSVDLAMQVPFNHHFNFKDASYYLDVRVSRTTPTIYPLVGTIRLLRA